MINLSFNPFANLPHSLQNTFKPAPSDFGINRDCLLSPSCWWASMSTTAKQIFDELNTAATIQGNSTVQQTAMWLLGAAFYTGLAVASLGALSSGVSLTKDAIDSTDDTAKGKDAKKKDASNMQSLASGVGLLAAGLLGCGVVYYTPGMVERPDSITVIPRTALTLVASLAITVRQSQFLSSMLTTLAGFAMMPLLASSWLGQPVWDEDLSTKVATVTRIGLSSIYPVQFLLSVEGFARRPLALLWQILDLKWYAPNSSVDADKLLTQTRLSLARQDLSEVSTSSVAASELTSSIEYLERKEKVIDAGLSYAPETLLIDDKRRQVKWGLWNGHYTLFLASMSFIAQMIGRAAATSVSKLHLAQHMTGDQATNNDFIEAAKGICEAREGKSFLSQEGPWAASFHTFHGYGQQVLEMLPQIMFLRQIYGEYHAGGWDFTKQRLPHYVALATFGGLMPRTVLEKVGECASWTSLFASDKEHMGQLGYNLILRTCLALPAAIAAYKGWKREKTIQAKLLNATVQAGQSALSDLVNVLLQGLNLSLMRPYYENISIGWQLSARWLRKGWDCTVLDMMK